MEIGVDMSELGFEGRVAVVTGAGRGIGRAYALLLAQRGAKVVVNDLGGTMEGGGADSGPAHAVVEEIRAAGGTAVADTHDISTQVGGAAVIDTALEHFGRIDVLVNNAGIIEYGDLSQVDLGNLERHLAVHPHGSFTTMWAAWPQFVEQGYGRVVLTTSSGVFGMAENLSYAAAKGGLIGLARSARLAGEPHDIKVNLVAPAAYTRMAGGDPLGEDTAKSPAPAMSPDAIAPLVAYLAHESCPVNGEIYTAGAGRFARLFLGSTEGYLHPDPRPGVEDVAANWDTVNDEKGYYVPGSTLEWSGSFLRHLIPATPAEEK
ncbi:SDR family NAD(P)-dependent oxidoreductase [Streptomyces sp. NPDC056656]|uniref:SDR family NAD(P)-dependent oxidoreductase n=1 Tax=Streptomyces sp. NPDC056656 TaxID=3345895 RepID=UPI0036D10EE0